jgi:hypothetical protein
METNIQLRSEVLEYSLNVEDLINRLLLFNLGIYIDKEMTKSFGNKSPISFKNKIDLLYDIDVLTKEEYLALDLQMVFRNKFLHDVNCNSFLNILKLLDNGLKNRFKVYFKDVKMIDNEDACRAAYLNLYLKNIAAIKTKAEYKQIQTEEKNETLQLFIKQVANYQDLLFDLITDLFLILESSELEDPKIKALSVEISEKLEVAFNTVESGVSFTDIRHKLKDVTSNPEKLKKYFGVTRSANNIESNE